jgi:hypothetical protein
MALPAGSGGSILVHAQTDLGCRQVLQETVFSSQRVHGIHASKYDDAASSVWVAVWGGSQVEVRCNEFTALHTMLDTRHQLKCLVSAPICMLDSPTGA